MSDYSEFFLGSKSSVVQLDLFKIEHINFTKTYRLVRNAIAGVTVTVPNEGSQTFEYRPMRISDIGTRENLDYGVSVDLGDLGLILPTELDAVSLADAFKIKPTVTYYTYRSDDLTTPLFGPVVLEVTSFNFNRTGASFECRAPSLNVNKTGETYRLSRFPPLRGFL